MQKHCIRSIKMYPDEWEKLEQLAVETGSRPTDGPHARLTTWPALLRRIARGELLIVDPKPDKRLEAIDKAIAENAKVAKRLDPQLVPFDSAIAKLEAMRQFEELQRDQARLEEQQRREQERSEEQRQRIAEQTKRAPESPLKLEQLQMELEPA